MRVPSGFRADSIRTPKASRAGALHLHIYTTPLHAKPLHEVGRLAYPSHVARKAAMR